MNDRQLTTKVREILDLSPLSYYPDDMADRFVRDPRVAMALLDKCDEVTITRLDNGEWEAVAEALERGLAFNESLSLTITMACVEALS